jgi:tetratricopeptide (TPR) repeat protein
LFLGHCKWILPLVLSGYLTICFSVGAAHAKRNFDERFAAAEKYRLANDNPNALREYTGLIKMRPADSRMHANLGWVLVQMQQYKEGKAEIDKALLLNDEDPYAHQAAAIYYMFTNDKPRARAEYIKVIALDPKRNCHCGGIQKYLGITPTDEKKALGEAARNGRTPVRRAPTKTSEAH